jgi:hypothetical protein
VCFLHTPTAQDAKNNGGPSQQERESLNSQLAGAINPDWEEWLMGYPVGWTDLRVQQVDRTLKGGKRLWRREPSNLPRITTEKTYRTQRVRALGNSIVPQVALQIFKAIEKAERS